MNKFTKTTSTHSVKKAISAAACVALLFLSLPQTGLALRGLAYDERTVLRNELNKIKSEIFDYVSKREKITDNAEEIEKLYERYHALVKNKAEGYFGAYGAKSPFKSAREVIYYLIERGHIIPLRKQTWRSIELQQGLLVPLYPALFSFREFVESRKIPCNEDIRREMSIFRSCAPFYATAAEIFDVAGKGYTIVAAADKIRVLTAAAAALAILDSKLSIETIYECFLAAQAKPPLHESEHKRMAKIAPPGFFVKIKGFKKIDTIFNAAGIIDTNHQALALDLAVKKLRQINPAEISRLERTVQARMFKALLKSFKHLARAAKDGRLEEIIPEWTNVKMQLPFVTPGQAMPEMTHDFTVGEHILKVVEYSDVFFSKDIDPARRRRICLLHDIGKRGYEYIEGDHVHYSAAAARAIMERLGYPKEVIDADCAIILHHNALDWLLFHPQREWPSYLDLNEFARFLTPEFVEFLLWLKISDMAGKKKMDIAEFRTEYKKEISWYIRAAERLDEIIAENKTVPERLAALKKAFFNRANVSHSPRSLEDYRSYREAMRAV